MNILPIPTFVVNLEGRPDRKEHAIKEFNGRKEFNVSFVKAIQHQNGAFGLWQSLRLILTDYVCIDWGYIIICEDDHKFTDKYNFELLRHCIDQADLLEIDVLSGGVSWLRSIFSITNNLYWTETFTGLQFTIIFKRFFPKILESTFQLGEAADLKIASMTSKKAFIYPFLSVQTEFGYSDVTLSNDCFGTVTQLFKKSTDAIEYLLLGESFYKSSAGLSPETDDFDFEDVTIPCYLMISEKQFPKLYHQAGKVRQGYEIKSVVNSNSLSEPERVLSFQRFVEDALVNDDEVLLYCENADLFLKGYDRVALLKSVVIAHAQGGDMLVGDPYGFDHLVPITHNHFWLDNLKHFAFIFVYKNVFHNLLENKAKSQTVVDLLSSCSTNKIGVIVDFYASSDYNARPEIQKYAIDRLRAQNTLKAYLNFSKCIDKYFTHD